MSEEARPEIGPDEPLTLEDAAKIAFRHGGMTAGTLRRQAERGNLTIERIGKRLYTTLAAIDEMRARCRVPARSPVPAAAGENGSAQASARRTVDEMRRTIKAAAADRKAEAKAARDEALAAEASALAVIEAIRAKPSPKKRRPSAATPAPAGRRARRQK